MKSQLWSKWERCIKCDIGKRAAKHVIGEGTLPCDVLFIGEAPGRQENMTGIPFCGPAGHILDAWLRTALYTLYPTKVTYYITNLVACRPCDVSGGPNRIPTLDEVSNCHPRLQAIYEMATPKAVVFVGQTAQQSFWISYPEDGGDPCFKILNLRHPAYALRRGGLKSPESKDDQAKLVAFMKEVFV